MAEPEPEGGRDGSARRRSAYALVAVGVVLTLLLVLSAFALGRLRSPDQVAADAQPPPPSLVTVAVEERDLTDHFVTRARPDTGSTLIVRLAAASTPLSVVTALPITVGTEVREGQLLAEVSGRPVFVFGGSFPAYRDLRGGDSGPDVRQVQEALVRLTYLTEISGRVDADTQDALVGLYGDRGYVPAPGADPAETVAAEQALDDAEQAVQAAETGLADARAGVADTVNRERAAAEEAIDAAEEALADAEDAEERALAALGRARSLGGPSLPLSEIVVLVELPTTLAVLDLVVGTDVTLETSVLGFAATASQLVADVPADVAVRFPVGSPATAEIGSATVPLVVASAGVPTEDVAGTVPLYLRAADEQASLETGGGSVLLDIGAPPGSSPVALAVPLTAVFSRPDGSEFVTVVEGGTQRDLTVRTGATALGWVGVVAVGDVGLEVGDEVLVGTGS